MNNIHTNHCIYYHVVPIDLTINTKDIPDMSLHILFVCHLILVLDQNMPYKNGTNRVQL